MSTRIQLFLRVAESLLILAMPGFAQPGRTNPQATPSSAQSCAAPGAQSTNGLEQVLRLMDKTAASFHAAQANFVWSVYNGVIKDFVPPNDQGTIYFRRTGHSDVEMAADIKPPDQKQIVFSEGKIQIYQASTKQVDVYDASAHKEEFETFLVLGFGSSGEEMRKSFDVQYAGTETVDGVKTAKLELTPLSQKIKDQFPKIDLWIDLRNGISVKQQLFQADEDYRLAKYSNIQLKDKLPNDRFKLKTPGGTKVVTH